MFFKRISSRDIHTVFAFVFGPFLAIFWDFFGRILAIKWYSLSVRQFLAFLTIVVLYQIHFVTREMTKWPKKSSLDVIPFNNSFLFPFFSPFINSLFLLLIFSFILTSKIFLSSQNFINWFTVLLSLNIFSVVGFEVDAINSVQFSNHTGYPKGIKGQVLDDSQLWELYTGLRENEIDACYSHVINGYIGAPSFLSKMAEVIKVRELLKVQPGMIPSVGNCTQS